jgi:transposase
MVVNCRVHFKEHRTREQVDEGLQHSDLYLQPLWEAGQSEWEVNLEIGDGHLVEMIDAVVDELDLTELLASYGGRGSPAYPPRIMLKIILYELQKGRCRPTQWHDDLKSNVVVQWIAGGLQPSRATLYRFFDRIAPMVDNWNAQVLARATKEGYTEFRRGVLDGTTMASYASRHRLVSAKILSQRVAALEACHVADQLSLPLGTTPKWMTESISGRRRQLQHYRQASERMQELQVSNRKRRSDRRKLPERVQISVSDPDAALGYDKFDTFRPLYNVQIIGDLDSPFVLAYDVLPQVSEANLAEPMLERMLQFTGAKPQQLLADSAYATPQDLAVYDAAGVEFFASFQENSFTHSKKDGSERKLPKSCFRWLPEQGRYLCPAGHLLDFEEKKAKQASSGNLVLYSVFRCAPQHCMNCCIQSSCTARPQKGRTVHRHPQQDLIDALQQRMTRNDAQRLYRQYRPAIERVFADLCEHRNLRRLSGRGLRRAKTQVGLTVLAHNLLSLAKCRAQKTKTTSPQLAAA